MRIFNLFEIHIFIKYKGYKKLKEENFYSSILEEIRLKDQYDTKKMGDLCKKYKLNYPVIDPYIRFRPDKYYLLNSLIQANI